MSDEAPKKFELQPQPAILTPPLGGRPKPPGRGRETEAKEAETPRESAAAPRPQPAPPPASATFDSPAADVDDVASLGPNLARALLAGGYHPVILFGTAFSGKTSLLLSLFSALISEPRLETGLVLCDPILGSGSSLGRKLHDDAVRLFEVGTQAFIAGEQTPKTSLTLPFFIPVEVRPAGKPVQRFAFLESSGEWYRPLGERGQRIGELERLFPKLRSEIETFIASFQGGISFVYLTPYTQSFVGSARDNSHEASEIHSASLAIKGVLEAYDRCRLNHRLNDRHLMLVSKWDAHSTHHTDRVEGVQEDRAALHDFCVRNYAQAMTAFKGISVDPGQRQLNAYCSGIINERGLLQLQHDDDLRGVVMGYPVRLWNWLYQNALSASDERPVPLFPEPPSKPALFKAWSRLLDFVSGR
jgi:hypothetical protein